MTRTSPPGDECALDPHQIECDVRRRLLSDPELDIQSLVVHRVANGVCIEGVVHCDKPLDDISQLVASIAGVDRVMNRLVHRRPALKG